MKTNRVYLILPAVVPFVLDVALTLCGQPREYWSGAYEQATETALVGRYLLQIHPLAFAVASVCYAVGFSAAIRYLPELLALWLSFGYLIAHTSGVNTWLLWTFAPSLEGWHNGIAAAWAAFCYSRYFKRRNTVVEGNDG